MAVVGVGGGGIPNEGSSEGEGGINCFGFPLENGSSSCFRPPFLRIKRRQTTPMNRAMNDTIGDAGERARLADEASPFTPVESSTERISTTMMD